MALIFSNTAELFATSSAGYINRVIGNAKLSRLLITISIENIQMEAVVDTGGAYLIFQPNIAKNINITLIDPAPDSINIRGYKVEGTLGSYPLTIIAEQGDNCEIEVLAFIPDPDLWETWLLPTIYLGWMGCLERFRFAIDPSNDTFYFGPAL